MSTLPQLMATGTKTLPEPMLTNHQWSIVLFTSHIIQTHFTYTVVLLFQRWINLESLNMVSNHNKHTWAAWIVCIFREMCCIFYVQNVFSTSCNCIFEQTLMVLPILLFRVSFTLLHQIIMRVHWICAFIFSFKRSRLNTNYRYHEIRFTHKNHWNTIKKSSKFVKIFQRLEIWIQYC